MMIVYLFIFLLAIISIGVYFVYSIQNKPIKKSISFEKKPVISLNSKKQLVFYWADWCGICKKIKPIWIQSKLEIKKKFPNLEIKEINCNDPDQCYVLKNSKKVLLEGVPTIILRTSNNDDIEYEKNIKKGIKGNKNGEDLIKFLNLYLNN